MENQKPQPKRDVEWKLITVLEEGDIGVEVKKLPLPKPRYSMSVVSKRKDGTWAPRFAIFTASDQGVVNIASRANDINTLLVQAEMLIQADAQEAEDSYWNRKREFEQRNVDRMKDQGGSADMQRKRIKDAKRNQRSQQ